MLLYLKWCSKGNLMKEALFSPLVCPLETSHWRFPKYPRTNINLARLFFTWVLHDDFVRHCPLNSTTELLGHWNSNELNTLAVIYPRISALMQTRSAPPTPTKNILWWTILLFSKFAKYTPKNEKDYLLDIIFPSSWLKITLTLFVQY